MRGRVAAGVGVAVLAGVVAAAGVGVGPALAHVTVNPTEAVQGGFAKLAFRVPNERDNASTVKLEVHIPAETAIASVSTRPAPGWTVAVERVRLAVPLQVHGSEVTEAASKITWTAAAGNEVKPGEFREFDVFAGPLPQVDQVVFKALQTYSTGEVVRWIEEPQPGAAEPEHPAPVLKLTTRASDADTGGAANANADLAASGAGTDDDDSGWATATGIAGLVAGLAGLVVGVLAWRRAGPRKS